MKVRLWPQIMFHGRENTLVDHRVRQTLCLVSRLGASRQLKLCSTSFSTKTAPLPLIEQRKSLFEQVKSAVFVMQIEFQRVRCAVGRDPVFVGPKPCFSESPFRSRRDDRREVRSDTSFAPQQSLFVRVLYSHEYLQHDRDGGRRIKCRCLPFCEYWDCVHHHPDMDQRQPLLSAQVPCML